MATSEISIEEIDSSIEFREEKNVSLGENIRCTLVGDLECGKTSVLLSYLVDSCPIQYVPTIFDGYSKRIKFRGQTINLLLNDIGGNEKLDQFVTGDVFTGDIGTDIFLICYSIDDANSYENVPKKWHKEIENSYLGSGDTTHNTKSILSKPIIILVGCKSDKRLFKDIRALRKSSKKGKALTKEPSNGQITISTLDGIKLASRIGAEKYFDCCAKRGSGIKEIFNEAIKLVLERRVYANIRR